MITKSDLLRIAKAIVDGMNKEITNRNLEGAEKFAVRGAALNALDNLWYDVCPEVVAEKFDYDRQQFINQVWDK